MTEQQKPVIASPWLPSQLRDLADEQTEEEGGPRDSDWMADAVLALRDAASQIEHLTWAGHLVPTVAATGQPYRVIADRDKGDETIVFDAIEGDLVIYRCGAQDAALELIRIERPVPTTDDPDEFGSDELATAYLAWRDRGPGRDCERVPVAFEAGWDAHATSVSTSLPTREQIDSAVGAVLFNVSNYPDPAQSRLWGRDIGPLRENVTAAVLALLSQPDPSTEWCGRRGYLDKTQDWDNPCVCGQISKHDGLHVCSDCGETFAGGLPADPRYPVRYDNRGRAWLGCSLTPEIPAAPPSIEYMAPGTRITGRSTVTGIWVQATVETGGTLIIGDTHWGASVLDPSTIRDVTPPSTAEDGDRG